MKKCLFEDCENLTSNPKFCSLSCGAKHQRKNTPRRVEERQCAREECCKTFETTPGSVKVYCSRSCAVTVNNRRSPKRKKGTQDSKFESCARCKASSERKYCSITCATKHGPETKITSWLSGQWDGTVQTGLSKTIRDYLIEQAGHRCTSESCAVPGGFAEVNPVTGKVPLEVDHLDGNCYNNNIENLRVVCPNCHALTPTYRALNRGNGRAYRRAGTW